MRHLLFSGLFSGLVSDLILCLEWACFDNPCCIEAVVAVAFGLFCSLMRVLPKVLPGLFGLFQGLCPLGMLRLGILVLSVICLPSFLGVVGAP